MSEPAAPVSDAERRAPRWMRNLLIVSLGLNLLTIGVIASAAWHMRHGPPFGGPGRLVSFVNNLPEKRAATVREMVEDARSSIRPLRQQSRQARVEAAKLFVADPFDKEQYAAAEQRLLEAELQVRRAYRQLVADVGSQLTAEERAAYLKWREEGWRRGRPSSDRETGKSSGESAERSTP